MGHSVATFASFHIRVVVLKIVLITLLCNTIEQSNGAIHVENSQRTVNGTIVISHAPSRNQKQDAHKIESSHSGVTLSQEAHVSGSHHISGTTAKVGLDSVWIKPDKSHTYTRILKWIPDHTMSGDKTHVVAAKSVHKTTDSRISISYAKTDTPTHDSRIQFIRGSKVIWTHDGSTYIAEGSRLYKISFSSNKKKSQSAPLPAFPTQPVPDPLDKNYPGYDPLENGIRVHVYKNRMNPKIAQRIGLYDIKENHPLSRQPVPQNTAHRRSADILPPPFTHPINDPDADHYNDEPHSNGRAQRNPGDSRGPAAEMSTHEQEYANISKYCTIRAFVTYQFRSQFNSWSSTSDTLEAVLATATGAFHNVDASGMYLLSVQQWDPEPVSDITDVLTQFTQYVNGVSGANSTCANVLFDAKAYADNHVGVAWLSGACGANNAAVVSHIGVADLSLILAHEIGHLMSAAHTEQYTECPVGTIMDADISYSAFHFCDFVGSMLSAWGTQNDMCLTAQPHTYPDHPHYDDNDLAYGMVALVLFLVVLFVVLGCVFGPLDSHCMYH